ncbi:hypothetical protein EVAR_6698_1 [Eumeta japonica]|uniref:Uncharacterized protein n=1 Tax=Eumeta variegata TaxID=151549 RepID=A0A4C1TNB5_EUMVA|nr:hypothetical protein EVAR_6698_1 [Eumeta japonica]
MNRQPFGLVEGLTEIANPFCPPENPPNNMAYTLLMLVPYAKNNEDTSLTKCSLGKGGRLESTAARCAAVAVRTHQDWQYDNSTLS